jgi:hypothetical protein
MVETDININHNQLTENEIKLLNSDHNNHIYTPNLSTPLIIKKLKNNQSQSIKISITNKDETINNNENQIQNTEAIRNPIVYDNNNNNNKIRVKSYTPPLFINQQFKLRYKDPKTGKLFSKISFENQISTSQKGSLEDGLNIVSVSDNRRMASSKTDKNRINPSIPIPLFRSQSSRLSKTKSGVDRNSSYYRYDDMTPTNLLSWKAKTDRIPVQMAPDRLYINTYMDHYVNNKKNGNSAKINNIKFQGVSPRNGSMKGINDASISTSQVFEQIFDMNSQFLTTYFPNMKRHNSSKLSSKAHTLPGHMVLESVTNQSFINPNGESKRPLKFENPSLYKTSKSSLSTSRSNQSSVNYDVNDGYDVDSIEIPIILKSPNSVNSYINYLRTRNNNIFNYAKA